MLKIFNGKEIGPTCDAVYTICETDATIWSKKIWATIALEVGPFRTYTPCLTLLLFFKYIPEVVFCEGVLRRLRFCLDHLNCVKMVENRKVAGGQVRRVGWVGDDSHVALAENSLMKKEV
jgi:hypothetical protein